MFDELKIIPWPDPRLKKASAPVERFDADLNALATRMIELMRANAGVGLAAPQVGLNIRLFVANPTGEPGDDAVYVNPVLDLPDGTEDGEEGCLSLPGIRARIDRSLAVRIRAKDADGNPVEKTASGLEARIWQHEIDHLDGVLILDRMGPVAKMAARKTLRELEEKYAGKREK